MVAPDGKKKVLNTANRKNGNHFPKRRDQGKHFVVVFMLLKANTEDLGHEENSTAISKQ